MGGMQIMLDKGEENDLFASSFIQFFAFLFVGGMAGLVIWELRAKNPVINLRLFRFKNFAICCFMMMLVGGVLNANTVLQPQFMQQLLGYNATTAGLALTAGGIALVIVMPLAGIATSKISARTLAVGGFILFTFTFRYAAAVTSLDMTFSQSRSEEHTSELQSHLNLVCRLLLEKKKTTLLDSLRGRCRRPTSCILCR